jgi:hypothetical protein
MKLRAWLAVIYYAGVEDILYVFGLMAFATVGALLVV